MSMDDNLRFPSGITVKQAKKDAKKLAKEESIPLNQAQDLIAAKNGIAKPWSRAISFLKEVSSLIVSLEFPTVDGHYCRQTLSADKNVGVICGVPGCGKSVLAAKAATRLLRDSKSESRVLYFTGDDASIDHIPEDYRVHDILNSERFNAYKGFPGSADLESLKKGDLLILDELPGLKYQVPFCPTLFSESLIKVVESASKKGAGVLLIFQSMSYILEVKSVLNKVAFIACYRNLREDFTVDTSKIASKGFSVKLSGQLLVPYESGDKNRFSGVFSFQLLNIS